MGEKKKDEIEKMLEELQKGEMDEEQMQRFLEEITKKKAKKSSNFKLAYMLGFLMYPKIWIHLLLTFVLNIAITCGIQGFFGFINYHNNIWILLLSIAIFTGIEFLFKFIIIRFFVGLMIYTVGIVFLAIQVGTYIGMDLWLYHYSFSSEMKCMVFAGLFCITRYAISRFIRVQIANYRAKKMMKGGDE